MLSVTIQTRIFTRNPNNIILIKCFASNEQKAAWDGLLPRDPMPVPYCSGQLAQRKILRIKVILVAALSGSTDNKRYSIYIYINKIS